MTEGTKLGIIVKDVIALNPSVETLIHLIRLLEKHAGFKAFMKSARTFAGTETEEFNLDEVKLLAQFRKCLKGGL